MRKGRRKAYEEAKEEEGKGKDEEGEERVKEGRNAYF